MAFAAFASNCSERKLIVRRVVAAVDVNCESFVASDEAIPDTGLVWTADPTEIRGWIGAIDPERVFRPAQPPLGGASWYISELPAGKGMQNNADHPPEMDVRGFHVTKTVDFIYVLSGTVVLDLDRESIELNGGDAVVLQAARHAWRNPTHEPARFLDVLMCRAGAPLNRDGRRGAAEIEAAGDNVIDV